ncbi:MAG: sensor histidine kinase [Flavobacteriales bacterium]|nr:sensor histidine kinase [Flavobacteriales bacterium]
MADPGGLMKMQDAFSNEHYSTPNADVPNLGSSTGAYWLKFNVENNSSEPSLIVHLPHPELDELDLYLVTESGSSHLASVGQSRTKAWRSDDLQEFAFSLPIEVGRTATVLLRVKSNKQIQVPILLSTPAAHGELKAERNLLVGSYVGVMLVMALYNLFVFFSIRERSYLLYVVYIVLVSMTQLTFFGFGQFYLWPDSTWLSSNASILFTLGTACSATEFMKAFLQTKQFAPRLHKLIKWFYAGFAVCLTTYLMGDAVTGYQMAQAISGIYALFFLLIAINISLQGSRQGRYFLLAWSLFLAGTVVFVLKDTGVLPYNMFTVYTMPLGSAVEGVLLSFALADRINILRKEKERSQAEALASSMENERMVRDQNVTLEHMVTERTHQLQDSLTYLKQTQSQLVEAEKMSSLGQLTAGIAHEINNPINFIKSNIPPLKRDLADVMEVLAAYRAGGAPRTVAELEERLGLDVTIIEVGKILQSMEVGANRTAEIVSGLRTFSRLDEGDMKYTDINDGIRSTLDLLTLQLKDRINVELDMRANESVECLPGKMNQVFMNLLSNAIHAVNERHGDKGGRISVVTEQLNDHLIVTITDNGIGMNEATRARVFEPFFTTKAVGDGTGLGLSIVHSIIEKHNGRIEVDSIQGQGTEFRVILPNSQPQQLALRA